MQAVEFESVSKSYPIYESPGDRLRELATFGRRRYHRDFQALRDVTFSVPRGEVFCIIGENGSGKSTTLQIMAGIMRPDNGRVEVNGRVSALLELGSGFNPEFSGRDNVYLNASILGLSNREIDGRYGEIAEFAEIGRFIEEPVKTYSSGMVMRLAFAVAIHVDPDVLLVDEALAVGDAYFRHRCMRKVHELRARGATIVFVSHSLTDVQAIGDRVMWLDHGQIRGLGNPDVVIPAYAEAMLDQAASDHASGRDRVAEATAVAARQPELAETIPNVDHRYGSGLAEITGVAVLNEFGDPLHFMMPGMRIEVRIGFRANAELARPVAGFVLRNHLGIEFAELDTARENRPLQALGAGETCMACFRVEIPEFYPHAFSFSPFLREGTGTNEEVCDWIDNAITVQMGRGEGIIYGYMRVPCRIAIAGAAVQEPVNSGTELHLA